MLPAPTATAGGATPAPDNSQPQPPKNFVGAVIDPESGRLVALAADLARALDCSQSVISRLGSCGKITKRGRFYDVLEASALEPGKNPPGRRPSPAKAALLTRALDRIARLEALAESPTTHQQNQPEPTATEEEA